MSNKGTPIDIKELDYDFNQPKDIRSKQFVESIQDPYRYKHGKHTVILEFNDKDYFDDCFAKCLSSELKNFSCSN